MWVKLKDDNGLTHLVNLDNILYVEDNGDNTCSVMFKGGYGIAGVRVSVDEIAEQISKHYRKVTAVEELAKIFEGENHD